MTEEARIDRVKRFSKIWWQSRADSQKSQEYMALSLGVSKKTIQNWEKGVSAPDLFQGCEWFRVLGLNPMPYYLAFLFPDIFGTPHAFENDRNIEQALSLLIEQSSSMEKRQLLFLMTARQFLAFPPADVHRALPHLHAGQSDRLPNDFGKL